MSSQTPWQSNFVTYDKCYQNLLQSAELKWVLYESLQISPRMEFFSLKLAQLMPRTFQKMDPTRELCRHTLTPPTRLGIRAVIFLFWLYLCEKSFFGIMTRCRARVKTKKECLNFPFGLYSTCTSVTFSARKTSYLRCRMYLYPNGGP